jgi:hypothetical protein
MIHSSNMLADLHWTTQCCIQLFNYNHVYHLVKSTSFKWPITERMQNNNIHALSQHSRAWDEDNQKKKMQPCSPASIWKTATEYLRPYKFTDYILPFGQWTKYTLWPFLLLFILKHAYIALWKFRACILKNCYVEYFMN